MSRLHQIRQYRDGILLVEYCRICSAENEDLLLPCPGKFNQTVEKKIDDSKQPDNNTDIENSGITRK